MTLVMIVLSTLISTCIAVCAMIGYRKMNEIKVKSIHLHFTPTHIHNSNFRSDLIQYKLFYIYLIIIIRRLTPNRLKTWKKVLVFLIMIMFTVAWTSLTITIMEILQLQEQIIVEFNDILAMLPNSGNLIQLKNESKKQISLMINSALHLFLVSFQNQILVVNKSNHMSK